MNFDEEINRWGSHCAKWDMLGPLYKLDTPDALSMWVADMDFRPPAIVQRALEAMTAHGVYGYFGDESAYLAATRWWMKTRHDWEVPEAAIFSTNGLVNGTGIAINAFSAPGDRIALLSPVYHAFYRVIKAAGREVAELPLKLDGGRYALDFAAWEKVMTGRERMLILCSPHNPGGRVWTGEELRAIADFCRRHDLILVSDEIHHDLTMPGQKHQVMAKAAPEITDRLLVMTATTKTFNIAGSHIGNVIVLDEGLRARFAARYTALGTSANAFGLHMATAAYSPEGAEWLDALRAYLQGNAQVFDRAIGQIPGLRSMPLEATYLAWVDFSGTGLSHEAIIAKVEGEAKIATNYGASFGKGGENYLRFNLATPRARVEEAGRRLQRAFGA